MKKLLLSIPVILLLVHFSYQSDGPNSWTATITTIGPIWQGCIVIHPTNQQIMYAASNTTGIWKSTNGGVNWTQSNGAMTNLTMQSLAISKSNPSVLYCGTGATGFSNGIYKTTDAGTSWTLINTGITQVPIAAQSLDISPTNPDVAYVCIWDGVATLDAVDGIYRTTNGGTNWVVSNSGIGPNKNILCVLVNPRNPNTVYCGTSFYNPGAVQTGPVYVYKSYNAGVNWTSFSTGIPSTIADINPIRMLSMSTIDTSVLVAGLFQNTTNGGAYFTSNGGTSWTRRSTGIPNVAGVLIRSILIRPGSNTEFYAGLDNATTAGIYKTTDAGVSWTAFHSGPILATYVVRALAFRSTIDSTLFAGVAGTAGQGIYEYSYGPLGIPNPNEIPTAFKLLQNYPNPFNPVTKIVYQIPKASYIKLSVYDASGKLVSILVDGYQSQLTNTVDFNAEGLSSGVYFYKIESGDFKDVKRMVLVK